MVKTISKKKCKKAKWLFEEALQIADERREVKGKGEKERYIHLNTEFWRLARRDENAFSSDQCKQIEENNRIGKTKDLFKKIRDTKGTFHAEMSTIKDRSFMDLTEAEDIKNRWQEHTEELWKKDLHYPDNHDGVITQLEPDMLECEIKQASESITIITVNEPAEVMESQVSYLKSWKMMLFNCCSQYASKFGKFNSAQDWKRSVFVPFKRKAMIRMFKLLHSCTHLIR